MTKSPHEYIPLTPLWFNILLAAADGPTHGYAVIKEIEQRTEGALSPGTGTVYVALQRLTQEGLLAEAAEGRKAYDDKRTRRHYELSERGREVCMLEARRMAREVEAALRRNILDPASAPST